MVCDADVVSTFPAIRQLRARLKVDEYLNTVERMRRSGYRFAAVVNGGRARSVAEFRIQEYPYSCSHVYVDDLITYGSTRSQGHDKRMLDWLTEEARRAGCVQIHLDSGVQRSDTRRFYFREGLNIAAYHFRKDIQ